MIDTRLHCYGCDMSFRAVDKVKVYSLFYICNAGEILPSAIFPTTRKNMNEADQPTGAPMLVAKK
jgi:hypothetical protein